MLVVSWQKSHSLNISATRLALFVELHPRLTQNLHGKEIPISFTLTRYHYPAQLKPSAGVHL